VQVICVDRRRWQDVDGASRGQVRTRNSKSTRRKLKRSTSASVRCANSRTRCWCSWQLLNSSPYSDTSARVAGVEGQWRCVGDEQRVHGVAGRTCTWPSTCIYPAHSLTPLYPSGARPPAASGRAHRLSAAIAADTTTHRARDQGRSGAGALGTCDLSNGDDVLDILPVRNHCRHWLVVLLSRFLLITFVVT
jgi:hypothetical protein